MTESKAQIPQATLFLWDVLIHKVHIHRHCCTRLHSLVHPSIQMALLLERTQQHCCYLEMLVVMQHFFPAVCCELSYNKFIRSLTAVVFTMNFNLIASKLERVQTRRKCSNIRQGEWTFCLRLLIKWQTWQVICAVTILWLVRYWL